MVCGATPCPASSTSSGDSFPPPSFTEDPRSVLRLKVTQTHTSPALSLPPREGRQALGVASRTSQQGFATPRLPCCTDTPCFSLCPRSLAAELHILRPQARPGHPFIRLLVSRQTYLPHCSPVPSLFSKTSTFQAPPSAGQAPPEHKGGLAVNGTHFTQRGVVHRRGSAPFPGGSPSLRLPPASGAPLPTRGTEQSRTA